MNTKQIEALKLVLEALEAKGDAWIVLERKAKAAIREALAEQPAQQECNHCGGTGDVSGEYPGVACPDCSGSGVQVKPEFFTHSVEQPYDWSDWVCPDPKSYLMKCCDCGLVHEAQFGVVRYKSEAEREGCDMVDDPNLQAVFRMRRSEQWSPEDTAHRAGGLPMEQPAQQQEPVALLNAIRAEPTEMIHKWRVIDIIQSSPPQGIYYTPPAQRKPLTDEEIDALAIDKDGLPNSHLEFARAIEAAHGIGEKPDAA